MPTTANVRHIRTVDLRRPRDLIRTNQGERFIEDDLVAATSKLIAETPELTP